MNFSANWLAKINFKGSIFSPFHDNLQVRAMSAMKQARTLWRPGRLRNNKSKLVSCNTKVVQNFPPIQWYIFGSLNQKIKKNVINYFDQAITVKFEPFSTLETDLAVFGSFLGSNSRVSLFIALITHYPSIKNRYLWDNPDQINNFNLLRYNQNLRLFLVLKSYFEIIKTDLIINHLCDEKKLKTNEIIFNPHVPAAQTVADEVIFRRFQGEGVEFSDTSIAYLNEWVWRKIKRCFSH